MVIAIVSACGSIGCSAAPLPSDLSIDCGPIGDRASCQAAIQAAIAAARIGSHRIVSADVRRPGPSDDCTLWQQACGNANVIAIQIRSGDVRTGDDTIQDVWLIPALGDWVHLDPAPLR